MVSGLGGQIFKWHCAKYRSLSQYKQHTNNRHVGTLGEQVNVLKGELKLLMQAKIREN
jgi:hypothetical protein